MLQVNIDEAKADFLHVLQQATNGEEIIIANAGKPMWRLTALEAEPKKRTGFGSMKGKIIIAPDAFDPMSEEELAEWYKDDLSS
jgi:antitoxin (DNA-binding transcriptional repressor) of toxin-antitoxin stability system